MLPPFAPNTKPRLSVCIVHHLIMDMWNPGMFNNGPCKSKEKAKGSSNSHIKHRLDFTAFTPNNSITKATSKNKSSSQGPTQPTPHPKRKWKQIKSWDTIVWAQVSQVVVSQPSRNELGQSKLFLKPFTCAPMVIVQILFISPRQRRAFETYHIWYPTCRWPPHITVPFPVPS